ncbi:MAG: aminotransferase class III-fold pyridoxal phosphate-dependent enzyme, partial [Fibrobacteres bacterium]|nr:aminotransferase class III-fold pyridoxal phosphate-dependent enzyme [Fibrobacterota bacterium]
PYPFVLDLKRSKGMYMATVDGDLIFDWAGFYGSKLLGYNHPGLYEKKYLESLVTVANNKIANPDFLTPECIEYYKTLRVCAPKCMENPNLEIYAVNSGAEAVENLSKYFLNLFDARCAAEGRPITARRMIYFDQAFHGRTIYALNMTQLSNSPIITKDYQGIVTGNLKVPFPAIDNDMSDEVNKMETAKALTFIKQTLEQYKGEVVGIIVEPIQGAGGQRVAQKEFFQQLSKLANDYNVYLGFDEVQTAGGQCGSFFLADTFDLPFPPQGIASGKKLANGVVYMLHPMKDLGILDSTWGGNLTDMVRFTQELKIITREKLMEQVKEKSELLVNGLKEIQVKTGKIRNVRGAGLYQGFSIVSSVERNTLVDRALSEEQMLLLEAGADSIRFRPAIDVTVDEIKLMLKKLDNLLKK